MTQLIPFPLTGGGWRVAAFSEPREDGETHGLEDRSCPADIQQDYSSKAAIRRSPSITNLSSSEILL